MHARSLPYLDACSRAIMATYSVCAEGLAPRARSLPYLDAVLKEALRLYPPAPTIIRQATRPMDLGGFRVQPGQWLAVAAYSMHRNPAYWPARPRAIPCTLSSCRMQHAPQLRLLAGAAPAPRSMQGRGRAPPEPVTAHAQCACAAARSLRWLAVDARGMPTTWPACMRACWPAPCCCALAQGNAACHSQGHELVVHKTAAA